MMPLHKTLSFFKAAFFFTLQMVNSWYFASWLSELQGFKLHSAPSLEQATKSSPKDRTWVSCERRLTNCTLLKIRDRPQFSLRYFSHIVWNKFSLFVILFLCISMELVWKSQTECATVTKVFYAKLTQSLKGILGRLILHLFLLFLCFHWKCDNTTAQGTLRSRPSLARLQRLY